MNVIQKFFEKSREKQMNESFTFDGLGIKEKVSETLKLIKFEEKITFKID